MGGQVFAPLLDSAPLLLSYLVAMYGIPAYRLPRDVIDVQVGEIEALVLTNRYSTPLRPGFGINELKADGFEAIFLAVGASRGRAVPIPGSDADGVIKAIDYLLNIIRGYRVPLGGKVVVIGLEEDDQFFSSPNVTRRIAQVFLVVFNLTLFSALAFDAPLEGLANPAVTPNPAKAPWYFAWLQELVASTTIYLGPLTVSHAFLGES